MESEFIVNNIWKPIFNIPLNGYYSIYINEQQYNLNKGIVTFQNYGNKNQTIIENIDCRGFIKFPRKIPCNFSFEHDREYIIRKTDTNLFEIKLNYGIEILVKFIYSSICSDGVIEPKIDKKNLNYLSVVARYNNINKNKELIPGPQIFNNNFATQLKAGDYQKIYFHTNTIGIDPLTITSKVILQKQKIKGWNYKSLIDNEFVSEFKCPETSVYNIIFNITTQNYTVNKTIIWAGIMINNNMVINSIIHTNTNTILSNNLLLDINENDIVSLCFCSNKKKNKDDCVQINSSESDTNNESIIYPEMPATYATLNILQI